jgi:hypothetical protein
MSAAPPGAARARPDTSASERGRGTASCATTAPGRGERTTDAVAQAGRLLDVVGDEQNRAPLLAQRLCQPVLHLAARQRVERGEGLVQAQDRLAREQRAQEGHSLRMPPESSWGRARSKPSRPKAANERLRSRARLFARRAGQPHRERGVVDRAQPRQQPVALGHEDAGSAAHAAGVGRLQAAHELEQRRLAAAAGPTTATISPAPTSRSRPSSARTAPKARLTPARLAVRPLNVSRLLRRSLELRRHRSLRGHYPTGSKGQRRSHGRYLSRPPPAPLLVCHGC